MKILCSLFTGFKFQTMLLLVSVLFFSACYGTTTLPTGPRGTLRFKCNESEAVLQINDTRLGPIGMFEESGVLLKPGQHRVMVYKDGFFKEYKLVDVAENELQVIEIAMTAIPD